MQTRRHWSSRVRRIRVTNSRNMRFQGQGVASDFIASGFHSFTALVKAGKTSALRSSLVAVTKFLKESKIFKNERASLCLESRFVGNVINVSER